MKRKNTWGKYFVLFLSAVVLILVVYSVYGTVFAKNDKGKVRVKAEAGEQLGKEDTTAVEDASIQDIYDYIDSLSSLNANRLEVKKTQEGADLYSKTEDDIKIMQLTDMHISGLCENYGKNILAMQTVYEMVEREQPDFIVATGDLVFGTAFTESEDDRSALDMVLKFMDAMGIAWTWTFGNHDHDYFDRLETEELAKLLSELDTLYMPENNLYIKGYSNGVFRVYRQEDLISAFILLDSNGEIWDDNQELITYDYIDDTQISWYTNQIRKLRNQAGKQLDTFVYMHIPIEEYAQIDESDYLSGKKREDVTCSEIHNDLAEVMAKWGSTRAVFCGHDHLNDFIAFYNGLYYVYGKSIDYTAYPGIEEKTEQRGMCVLIINRDNTFDIQNIRYD